MKEEVPFEVQALRSIVMYDDDDDDDDDDDNDDDDDGVMIHVLTINMY